jgi:integrase
MASIQKRKNKNGTSHWHAVVRIKGDPTVCNHFDRKQEADGWAADIERQIKAGKFKFDQHNTQHSHGDVVNRFTASGALEHHKSSEDTIRHLKYWKERLGAYALVHLTPEKLGKERQLLIDPPTDRGTKHTPATVNRYIASLSSSLTYACRQLCWIDAPPCFNFIKLKEAKGRDRVLTDAEISKLLASCRQNKSPYLYCIVLMSLPTGARQGEILGLEWRHVDFDNKLADLKETKNGCPKSISLADSVIDVLKALHQARNPAKPLVFTCKTAFGRIAPKKAWNEALKRAGIEDYRAHDMRHTFCPLASKQGGSNLELATAMGHRTLGMLQRYTHLDVQVTKKIKQAHPRTIFQGQGASS